VRIKLFSVVGVASSTDLAGMKATDAAVAVTHAADIHLQTASTCDNTVPLMTSSMSVVIDNSKHDSAVQVLRGVYSPVRPHVSTTNIGSVVLTLSHDEQPLLRSGTASELPCSADDIPTDGDVLSSSSADNSTVVSAGSLAPQRSVKCAFFIGLC